MRHRALPLLALAVLAARPAAGQTAAQLVDRGVQAYQGLDLGAAAGFLRRALSAHGGDSLVPAERIRALSYLGATEALRGNADSTVSAFRSIVLLSPRHRLDDLVFPPDITAVYEAVRRDTKAVRVELPETVRFRAGQAGLRAQLLASSFHQIVATVDRSDGTTARLLFQGLIGDSLEVLWDGLDGQGTPVPSARYVLSVESRDASGESVRIVRVPLEIRALEPDTLPHPVLAESTLLPERTPEKRNVEALVGGVVGGIGLAVLPSLLATDTELSAGRFVVAGTVTVAGVVGFITQRGGRAIPANVAANEAARQAWRADVDRVTQENTRLRSRAELAIRVGRAEAVDLRQP